MPANSLYSICRSGLKWVAVVAVAPQAVGDRTRVLVVGQADGAEQQRALCRAGGECQREDEGAPGAAGGCEGRHEILAARYAGEVSLLLPAGRAGYCNFEQVRALREGGIVSVFPDASVIAG